VCASSGTQLDASRRSRRGRTDNDGDRCKRGEQNKQTLHERNPLLESVRLLEAGDCSGVLAEGLRASCPHGTGDP